MYAQEIQEKMSSTCGLRPETIIPDPHAETVLDTTNHLKTNFTYACGESTVNLRVIVHFMLKSDGTGNFNEFNDGRVNDPVPSGAPSDYHYQWNGYRYAAELIHAANTIMIPNDTLKQTPFHTCSPLSAPYPAVFPKRVLYTLQDVYFHRNSTSYNEYYTYATSLYKDIYAVKKDSCIQIYLFSNTSGPSGYVFGVPGSDNNMACFLKNHWQGYNVSTGLHWQNTIWSDYVAVHKVFNHEIMHLLGLHHTNNILEYRDFCQDTPDCNNKSEYNTIVNDGLCTICQSILTPDQLYRVHTTLSGGLLWTSGNASAKKYTNTNYVTKYRHKCESCPPVGSPPYSFFHLNTNGCGEVFMGGGWYGTWYSFANQFIEIFETNAIGSNTVTGPYYSGWRTVDVYSFLRNLSSLYNFEHGKIYKIKMAVNTSCVSWHEQSQWIVYNNPNPCERLAPTVQKENTTAQVYPNPVIDKANLTFVYPTQHIQVIDITGKVVDTFVAQDVYFATWEPRLDMPNGLYFIISDNKQNSYLKIILQR